MEGEILVLFFKYIGGVGFQRVLYLFLWNLLFCKGNIVYFAFFFFLKGIRKCILILRYGYRNYNDFVFLYIVLDFIVLGTIGVIVGREGGLDFLFYIFLGDRGFGVFCRKEVFGLGFFLLVESSRVVVRSIQDRGGRFRRSFKGDQFWILVVVNIQCIEWIQDSSVIFLGCRDYVQKVRFIQ